MTDQDKHLILLSEVDALCEKHLTSPLLEDWKFTKAGLIQAMGDELTPRHLHPISFGRWLLKHATPKFVDVQFLTWAYKGKCYDTSELYELYLAYDDFKID